MSSIKQAENACVFCYRSISSSNPTDTSVNIKTFVKFLTRLDDGTKNRVLFEQMVTKLTSLSKVLQYCEDCCVIIESFCDIYHEIKCLELKLNSKLDKLGRKIELANKIPTRWINFNSALKRTFQGDNAKTEEGHNEIKILRSKIVESGVRQLAKSLPRVVLKRIYKYSSDDDTYEVVNDPVDTETTTEQHGNISVIIGDPLIETKLEYPNIPFVENNSSVLISLPSQCELPDTVPNVTCFDCGIRRNTEQELWLHQNEAHSILKCLQCGKPFKTKQELRIHLGKHRHPTKWKFKCKSCGKKCPHQASLKTHLRIHTGENPHTCQFCGIQLRWRRRFRRHLMDAHGLSDEMSRAKNSFKGKGQFKCELCGNIYLHKSNLGRHLRKTHKIEQNQKTSQDNVLNENEDAGVETDVIYKLEADDNESLRDTMEITIKEEANLEADPLT